MLGFLRSVGALIVAYIAVCVVIMSSFAIGLPLKLHESVGGSIVLLALSGLGGAVGGWVAGRLAGRRPRVHSLVLAVLMFAGAVMMAIHPEKDREGRTAPAWFRWSLAALVMPATMAGGMLVRSERKKELAEAGKAQSSRAGCA